MNLILCINSQKTGCRTIEFLLLFFHFNVLLPQNLLYLADLSLYSAGDLFNSAFSPQFWIIAQFSGDLLDCTLHFVERACCLVLCA